MKRFYLLSFVWIAQSARGAALFVRPLPSQSVNAAQFTDFGGFVGDDFFLPPDASGSYMVNSIRVWSTASDINGALGNEFSAVQLWGGPANTLGTGMQLLASAAIGPN